MKHREPNGMTVNELIEALEEMRAMGMGEVTVMFSYGSGDYWDTVIARNPEHVDVERIKWTDYHRTWETLNLDLDEYDPDQIDDEEQHQVVVIS
jgi:hypothetical protein